MRLIKVCLLVVVTMGIVSYLSSKLTRNPKPEAVTTSVYDFNVKALDGKDIDFSQYRGKPILIVNTASKCGYTYQYEDLEKLHEQYGSKVTVLGFPANNFLWQEPGNNEEIASFCQRNYGVSFQMFGKVSVKGKDQHPVFQWLAAKSGKVPTWNFCKYLIDKDGNVVTFYPPTVSPMDESIISKIENP